MRILLTYRRRMSCVIDGNIHKLSRDDISVYGFWIIFVVGLSGMGFK